MFLSLTVSNWVSFRETSTLSMVSGKMFDNDRRFMPSAMGQNVARTAVIFGANASGKTNFLKAITFLSWFIHNSWREGDSDDVIPFFPFRFTKKLNVPSKFEVVTEDAQKNIYYYALSLTTKTVLSESLSVRKVGSKRKKMLFSREGEVYHRYPDSGFLLKDIPASIRRRNASFIATVKQTELTCFNGFLETMRVQSNVNFIGRVERRPQNGFKDLAHNEELRTHVEQMLADFDTGISALRIKTQKAKDDPKLNQDPTIQQAIESVLGKVAVKVFMESEIYHVSAVHVVDGHKYILPLQFESNGTVQLISLLPEMLKVLDVGSVLVYDELEHGIHPNLLPFLLDLFYSEENNPHGAQLICSCHASDIMRTLDKRQIAFTQKNERQESELYMLDDFQRVRNDDNYEAKYLSGVYGAVPEL